jgi:hypothetical protein
MNNKVAIFAVVAALILGAAILLLMPAPEPPQAAAPAPTPAAAKRPATTYADLGGSTPTSADAASPSASPTPSNEPFVPVPDKNGLIPVVDNAEDLKRSQINDTINEAVVTYSAEGIKVIRPYLTDSDPEIRESALNGMIQLGVPEAAKALREVSKQSSLKAKERLKLLEAADFIDLPSYVFPTTSSQPAQAAPAPSPAAIPAN